MVRTLHSHAGDPCSIPNQGLSKISYTALCSHGGGMGRGMTFFKISFESR